ncbi:MAG: helix-turn-helix domain-containing protein, partial [bacterium]|nr:helix-turn-helix domain-containing protein [bacterium]
LIDDQMMLKHLDGFESGARHLPMPVNRPVEQVEREFIYHALLELKSEIHQLRELILTRLFPPKRLKGWEAEDQIIIPHDEAELVDDQTNELRVMPSVPEMEKKLIEETLNRYDRNKRKAAASLKISERTLYRKIKEYNLDF